MDDVIVRRSDAERTAYGQGFEAGARLILKHWRGNLTADKSEELLASLLTLFQREANDDE